MNHPRPLVRASTTIARTFALLVCLFVATSFALLAVGCTPTAKTTINDERVLADGPQVVKNVGRMSPTTWQAVTDGGVNQLDLTTLNTQWQAAGPIHALNITDGRNQIGLVASTDFALRSLAFKLDPETSAVLEIEIGEITTEASSVVQSYADVFERLYGEAFVALSADRRDALIATTEELIEGGIAVTDAARAAWEAVVTAGASALIPGGDE